MKKIIGLLIIQLAILIQPCGAQNLVNQQMPLDDSLNFQMIDGQINELEAGFLSSNHLKSGIADINLPDSTQQYHFINSSDSILRERTLYTYLNADRIKTELQYKWNKFVNRWMDFKYENTYDRSNRIIMKNFTGWYLEFLQGKGSMSRGDFHLDWDKDTTIAIPYTRIFSYEYNRSGQLKWIWRFTLDQDDTPLGSWYECDYDTNGSLKSIDSGGTNPPYVEEYTYGSNNFLVTVTQSRFIEYNYISLWFCSSKIKYEYTYDADNRVSSIQSYYFSFKANEWRNTAKVDYSYQANGNLDSRLYSIIDTTRNELMPADRTDFKYSKNNKIQRREDYAWNKTTSQREIRKKLFYYYNNTDPKAKALESHLAEETPLRIYPNPSKDILWIESIDDTNAILHIYNSNGQCVFKDKIENGINRFNLSSLPSGIYFYKIRLNSGLNSGKLLIE